MLLVDASGNVSEWGKLDDPVDENLLFTCYKYLSERPKLQVIVVVNCQQHSVLSFVMVVRCVNTVAVGLYSNWGRTLPQGPCQR